MTSVADAAEAVFKMPRPDERRETTNSAFKLIVNAEISARIAKTRRLQEARMAAAEMKQ